MKIDEFKKGDIITRTVPEKQIKNSGFGFMSSTVEVDDYSKVGQPVVFVGIANGLIYFKENGKIDSLPFNKCKEGWSKYIDPKTL